MVSRVQVLVPTPPAAAEGTSATFSLGGRLAGVKVGLRLDSSWRSYFTVVDVWERRLREEQAEPIRWLAGNRTGSVGEQTRADLDEWARLVDCGVIGLGN